MRRENLLLLDEEAIAATAAVFVDAASDMISNTIGGVVYQLS